MITRVALAALCLALACGCDYGGDEGVTTVSGCGVPRSAEIDTGTELDLVAGEGVGVFFEYLGGGEWRVTTACDTLQTAYECYWDVYVSPLDGGELFDFGSTGLEGGDSIQRHYDGSLQLLALTSIDLDGMSFFASPGSALRFDALLDGYCANPYMYWAGGGAVHTGSPSNPLDLVPTSE